MASAITNGSAPEIRVVLRPPGVATSPTRKALAPFVRRDPTGESEASASLVASGTSSLAPNRTGARSGGAINTDAAMPERQSSLLTIDTALGRVAVDRPG